MELEKNTLADQQPSPVGQVSTEVQEIFQKLLADPKVVEGLAFLQADNDNTTTDQIRVTEIAAPSFQEQARGEYYKKRLQELGLQDVHTDSEGNVFGIRPGTGNGPRIVVCAHLDTVFPEGTDTTVKEADGKIYGPGIGDDGRGLAVVLTLLRVFEHLQLQTHGDILFGATVGEEGLGDLRGVKALFRNRDDIDGFISIEPGPASRNTYDATGSHRYNITYRGPGGHSFGAFGTPSALHALGRAIAKIADVQTPIEPKTTFTVGTVSGGTSINSIAASAKMAVDLRSNSQEELLRLEERVLALIKEAAEEENQRWGQEAIQVEIELIGDRPAGSQPDDAIVVQAAVAATRAIGFEPESAEPSSTDSNVPISLGIPSLTLGGGGDADGAHTPVEWFDPTDAYVGPQKIFLTILGLVGVVNLTEPLLGRNTLQKNILAP